MNRVALALVTALAAGCGGQMNPPAQTGPFEVSMLAIGGGQSDGSGFVNLTDGQDTTLVSGAQGGFHLWVNARFDMTATTEPLPDAVVIDRQARIAETGELVSSTRERRSLAPAADGSGAFELDRAMPMFLCPAPVGIRINDRPLTVRVRILADEHAKDAISDASIKLTPHCPTGDLAAFCARICND